MIQRNCETSSVMTFIAPFLSFYSKCWQLATSNCLIKRCSVLSYFSVSPLQLVHLFLVDVSSQSAALLSVLYLFGTFFVKLHKFGILILFPIKDLTWWLSFSSSYLFLIFNNGSGK